MLTVLYTLQRYIGRNTILHVNYTQSLYKLCLTLADDKVTANVCHGQVGGFGQLYRFFFTVETIRIRQFSAPGSGSGTFSRPGSEPGKFQGFYRIIFSENYAKSVRSLGFNQGT